MDEKNMQKSVKYNISPPQEKKFIWNRMPKISKSLQIITLIKPIFFQAVEKCF